ncbi:TPA: helix-turn-helix transcriptional regulator [Klebsiella aerogenes]|nr:helix-turn-helix transcriptional regulator [Klebsiella aerogenes]
MSPVKQLEALMNKHGITKYKLSKLTGCSPSYIYDVFSGRSSVSNRRIQEWAELLGFEMVVTIKEKE